MAKFSGARILAVHELIPGQKIHGGMVAGKCAVWMVVRTDGKNADLKLGTTIARCTGHDLREMEYYRESECPVCQFNHTVKPHPQNRFRAIPQEIEGADVPSSFRFRAAQYRGIKKSR